MPAPRDFERYIRELEKRITLLERRSPFTNTGLSIPGPGVTQVDGNLVVLGDFTAEGKVSNDALTTPVVPGIAREVATNFALTAGTLQEKAGTDLVVPDGCTRLLATVTGRLYAVNTHTTGGADGTGTDALYVALKLGAGSATLATPTGVSGYNGFATTTAAESYSLDTLTPGSTIRLGVYGACGYVNFAAHPDNRASYAATLIWLR